MMFPVSRILELRLFKHPQNEDYYKCVSFIYKFLFICFPQIC